MIEPSSKSFTEAINEALIIAMQDNQKVLCFGLGVDDPKRIFSTTNDLIEKFGAERVFDMPTSENAMTGVAVGMALGGYTPVMVHQRLDFFLLALDQLVNSAAKWFYMFGGQANVPMVIRLIVGRGWGQGPTHSQALHSWFAHVPGLKVVMPSNPNDAKGLLLQSICDGNPVVFIEHRWLHAQRGIVQGGDFKLPLGKANVIKSGEHVTLVGISLMVVEAQLAAEHLAKFGVYCEVIDLRTVRPIDWHTIEVSVAKTGRLLALDIGHGVCSVASEIVASVAERCFESLLCSPRKVTLPDHAVPTSYELTKGFYPGASEIVSVVSDMLGKEIPEIELKQEHHDVPGSWFTGPF